jgi:uncharacterized membrane protein
MNYKKENNLKEKRNLNEFLSGIFLIFGILFFFWTSGMNIHSIELNKEENIKVETDCVLNNTIIEMDGIKCYKIVHIDTEQEKFWKFLLKISCVYIVIVSIWNFLSQRRKK